MSSVNWAKPRELKLRKRERQQTVQELSIEQYFVGSYQITAPGLVFSCLFHVKQPLFFDNAFVKNLPRNTQSLDERGLSVVSLLSPVFPPTHSPPPPPLPWHTGALIAINVSHKHSVHFLFTSREKNYYWRASCPSARGNSHFTAPSCVGARGHAGGWRGDRGCSRGCLWTADVAGLKSGFELQRVLLAINQLKQHTDLCRKVFYQSLKIHIFNRKLRVCFVTEASETFLNYYSSLTSPNKI